MVPYLVRFSQYAVMTRSLEAKYPGFQLAVDGVGLVTGFLATEGWVAPIPVSTAWSVVFASVTTTWANTYSAVSTTWTVIDP